MYNHADKANDIALALGKVTSLMEFMGDYFKHTDPSANDLLTRHSAYQGMFYTIDGILREQHEAARTLTREMFEDATSEGRSMA